MRKDRSHDPLHVLMDAVITKAIRHLRAMLDEHGLDITKISSYKHHLQDVYQAGDYAD